jgi:hypothetical protein
MLRLKDLGFLAPVVLEPRWLYSEVLPAVAVPGGVGPLSKVRALVD